MQLVIASIVLGNPAWKWLPVVAGLLALIALLFAYHNVRRPFMWKAALTTLKLLSFVFISLCLLNPLWSQKQIKPGENIIVLLADNSASLNIRSDTTSSRGEVFRNALNEPEAAWKTRLEQDFDVRRFSFGDRISQVDGFEALSFQNSASNLQTTLATLKERFASQPIAAILLFTDGNATDQASGESASGIPIYPVMQPSNSEVLSDVSIQNLSVSQSAFEDAPVNVVATINFQNMPEETCTVVLESVPLEAVETNFKPQSQMLVMTNKSPVTARFQVRPTKAGISFYRLRVFPTAEDGAFDDPKLSTEVTLANNERLISIDRGDAENRILYVGGRPNWEYKFLNRALAEDEKIKMVSLIRISRKEAKFDFRGRAGETSNSLFRGFNNEPDAETEAYDEAVVIRLNARDKNELSGGFPKAKEELYPYQAIILDDVETAFFSHDQMVLLDHFVSERGGGLLMLGGRDSYRHGEWHKSPLKDALPIYLDRPTEKTTGELHWDLTREGWLEPWMRLRETETSDKKRLSSMPAFTLVNSTREVKPGARVLATVKDDSQQEIPSMVVQKYGKGSTGAVLVGDLWRWTLQRGEESEDDLAKSWRQMIRWLVSDVPSRIETSLEWTQLGQIPALNLKVSISDKEFQPQDNAAVNLTIHQPDGTELTLKADASLEKAGLFEATYVPRSAGAYLATINVVDEKGVPAGTAEVGWTSDPVAEEFREVSINEPFLKVLAENSGGELVPLSDLENFVTTLPLKEMPVTEVKITPLWHTPWLLLLAIACLAGEWGMRRWRGLP